MPYKSEKIVIAGGKHDRRCKQELYKEGLIK